MAENIINLRKEVVEKPRDLPKKERENAGRLEEPDGETPQELFWTAPEFAYIPKGGYWYAGVSSITVFLVVLGVVAESVFFVVFVVLAALLVAYYGHRRPRDVAFSVTAEGIDAGGTSYPYANLKSFWIFDRRGESELSVETASVLHPVLRIPLMGVSAEDVREYLAQYLPEEEHRETFSDRLMRAVRI